MSFDALFQAMKDNPWAAVATLEGLALGGVFAVLVRSWTGHFKTLRENNDTNRQQNEANRRMLAAIERRRGLNDTQGNPVVAPKAKGRKGGSEEPPE